MLKFYKECLPSLDGGEVGSMLYMCPCFTMEYPRQWCQDALDFVYRMMQSGLMGIDYPDNGPTPEETKDIFDQLAQESPNIPEGGAIWSTYQFYLTDEGQKFLNEWNKSGDDQLYWEKLKRIFDKHNVGFDKSGFVPVKF